MKDEVKEFSRIFSTQKEAVINFMSMLEPAIQNAQDEHEKLHFHHIYEEEEQRLTRLNDILFPLIETFEQDDSSYTSQNKDFQRFLQELNLEKFGLHNFVEHLDLALYQFKDDERQEALNKMRAVTYDDYRRVKDMLNDINNRFDHDYVDPHEHHDREGDHLAPENNILSPQSHATTGHNTQSEKSHLTTTAKKLTVGSLIDKEGMI